MNSSHSLRGRLLGSMLVVFALGLAASLVSYRLEVHSIIGDLHARTLQAQAQALVEAVQAQPRGTIRLDLPADWEKVYRDPSQQFAFTLFDAAHRPIAQSPNLAQPLGYIALPPKRDVSPVAFAGAGRAQKAVLAAKGPDGIVAVVARSGMSRDILVDSLFAEDSEQLLVMAPFALLALGLIWVISGWSLRPIARASREAAVVGPGKPDMRISARGLPREIRPLVDAVNGALDRLSRAYATERQLTADAAHELRTPLAVLTLRLQRARLSEVTDWPAVERELAQMARLVEQLLDLARKESQAHRDERAGLPVVNLSRIVREAAATVVPLIESHGRHLDVAAPDAALVRGRADDLRDMIRNLLDNALVHGRGTIAVRVHRPEGPSPDGVMVEVSDEGDGVPAAQEEAVFERFRKLTPTAPGSGLGLAIVRQVARNHGGDAWFVAGRACIVLTLPAIPSLGAAMGAD